MIELKLPKGEVFGLAAQDTNWCVWKKQPRNMPDGTTKIDKIPWDIKSGHAVDRKDAAGHTLADAGQLIQGLKGYGVGYLSRPGSALVSLDLDHCIHDGAIAQWALDIVGSPHPYMEVSPSGNGLRVLLPRREGDNDLWEVKNPDGTCGLGFYANDARFFTVTFQQRGAADIIDVPGIRDRVNATRAKWSNNPTKAPTMLPPVEIEMNSKVIAMFQGLDSLNVDERTTHWFFQLPEDQQKGCLIDALRHLTASDRDEWIRHTMACKWIDLDWVHDVWDRWCQTQPKYESAGNERTWASMVPDRKTIGSLFLEACTNGWQENAWHPADMPTQTIGSTFINPGKPIESVKLQHITDAVFEDIDTTLVEDLLDDGAVSVLFGKPGLGKTFNAIDLAAHVAYGQPWRGREVKQGVVIYLALEGGKMFQRRLIAVQSKFPGLKGEFYFRAAPLSFNGKNAVDQRELDAVVSSIKELVDANGEVKMVIVDTLSRALAGGNENAPEDMGAFIRSVDKIRDALQCHVMVVHHAGKDEARGMRGHSSLLGAIDTELVLTEKDGVKTLGVGKQRDFEFGSEFPFELKPYKLGTTKKGKDVFTCTVEMCEPGVPEVKPVTENQQVVLKVAIAAMQNGSCHLDKIRDVLAKEDHGKLYKDLDPDDKTIIRNRINRDLKALGKKALLVKNEDGSYSLPDMLAIMAQSAGK